ncbi:aminotransferase class III-fold pyridoxal phosphate-dependent enzyme [Actinopolymorpha alba]|uniref:aminotransferase class III-fold pyridoxal phosphate-dependent enzyme n=1 Tax=Actinopolymorpha alba TaxID=533267 RepID=UPI00035D28E0|nr:aminotransferase class III-fold pyridoxal phosphate-dependent enzyme [Actinopolymorpha alba]
MTADPESLAWVAKAQREHVLTSWSKQSGPDPLVVVGGEGCYFVDSSGRRHLDFMSQLVNLNLGYQHPRLVEAIKRQADELCYIGPNLANEARSKLALQLAELAPGNLTASFFTTGGAAANENAIKLARHYTGRHKIITRYRSYHGATAGAITLSGEPRRWPAEPGMPGVVRMLDPYTYRCPAGHPDPCPVCSGGPHLEEILQYENPETVAAVVLETVTGTNGPIVPPDGYLRSIREVCDKYGILLILDEVMVGFGRLGSWFGCEHWDVVPDIISVAKGLNSGYVPLGAMIVSEPIRDWLREHTFSGGLTYSGHPLACASGVASIEIMKDEKIVENAATQGILLERRLRELADRHPSIGDIRGLGLMWGIELVRDRETKEPLAPFNAKGSEAAPISQVIKAAKDKGVHFGAFNNVIRLAPPLIITEAEIDEGIGVLDEALTLADQQV